MNVLAVMKVTADLPVIISAPGDYRTRDGGRVTIYSVQPVTAPYTFKAKGCAWQLFRGKQRPARSNVWHVSGRLDMVYQKPGDIVGPWVECCPVLMWEDLTADQQASAAEKYFPGVSDEWPSAADYFTYDPDGFISFDGEVYDIDAEAVAISDPDLQREYCAGRPGTTIRYLPSSKNLKGYLIVRYYTLSVIGSFDVFRAEVPNV